MTQPLSHDQLIAFSRERIEKGSRSFAVAARLFDDDTRADAYMLYAWCRHCDDVVDGQALGFHTGDGPEGDAARAIVADLEEKTRAACRGQADEPVFQALAEVCRRCDIPERYPLDLIAGFRMDAEDRAYGSLADTLSYCYHVAGVVGVMMAQVMGVRDRVVLDRACDLGLAFQMTNIARDVVADCAVGRVYLPADWLEEAGLSHATMAAPANRDALFGVVERLLDTAEPYYASARLGQRALPFRSAWAVAAATEVYRGIGEEVRRRGPRAWDQRAGTSALQKLGAVTSAGFRAASTRLTATSAVPTEREGLWTMSSDLPRAPDCDG